jgi:hypothetical protein
MQRTAISNDHWESQTNKFLFMAASVGGLFHFVGYWPELTPSGRF